MLFLFRYSFLLTALASTACVRWSPVALAPAAAGSCRSDAVEWLTPDDARERQRLDPWCDGVGPVATNPLPGGMSAPPVSIDDVTFVSWNVHVGNGDLRTFVRDLRAGALTGPDHKVTHFVLLLQEALRTSEVPPLAPAAEGARRITANAGIDIVELTRELGLSLIYVPSMRNGDTAGSTEDRGNAIVSTLPLSNPIAVELPGERQRRVAILATLGSFSAGVVHLDVVGSLNRLRVFWTPWMRDRQIRSLTPALPDGPTVVGADMNAWHGRGELAVRSMMRALDVRHLDIDRHGLGLRALDYLFFRTTDGRRPQFREIRSRYGSDHRPLVGWIE